MSIAKKVGRAWCCLVIALFCHAFPIASVSAQLPPTLPNPRLTTLLPAGGQSGKTVDVTVTGSDLDDAKQLSFNHPGISAALKMAEPGLGQTGAQPVYGSFQVKIAADVLPGVYELRVLGKFGLSNPRAFAVGNLLELMEKKPNNLAKLANEVGVGCTINGFCETGGVSYFKFAAKKGQRIIIDCWAFRLGSRLDGTLVLFDSTGRELKRDHNTNRRDPMIDFTASVDGEYVVGLHDQSFGYFLAAPELYYRLSISTSPYLDFIFPPVGTPGSKREYTIYGRNLPGGKPAPGVEVGGNQLEMMTATIPLPAEKSRDLFLDGGLYVEPSEAFMDGISFRLKSDAGFSNPIFLSMSETANIIESQRGKPANEPVLLQPPCEFVGQFYPRGRREFVSFMAKKGEVHWIEVYSQRLGMPTDPRIVVSQIKRDDKGVEQVTDVQTADDNTAGADRTHQQYRDSILYNCETHDPSCKFIAPEDGTYRIMIEDIARPAQDVMHAAKGDPRRVYRLAIRRPAPDYRLVAMPRPPTNLPSDIAATSTIWSPVLRPGGTEMIAVYADRRDGFEGEIEVTADNLPPGVTAAPIVIAPKQNSATLILKAAENAQPGYSAIKVRGRAKIGQTEAVRQSRYATMMWPNNHTNHHRSRLCEQLCVSVIAESAPLTVEIDPKVMLEASLAGKDKIPVKVVRRGKFTGPIELHVFGLPPTIYGPLHAQPKYSVPTAIAADKDSAELTVTVPNGVPPGTYSFFIGAVATVSYSHNPEKLRAAEARLAAIEKVVTDNEAKLKAAIAMQTAAAKALTDAEAAKKEPKGAKEAKLAADKAVAEADQKAKQDAAFLVSFRQEVVKLKDQCKPTDLKFSTPSNRATMKIRPVPFEFKLSSDKVTVKQGAKVEVPVTIKRLYGFADPINMQFNGVHNISGINAPVLSIPAGQSEGKLVIDAFANAAVGTYSSFVQINAAYNAQPVSDKADLTLTIEHAAPPKK